jgi:hypothetical protein
VIIFAQKGISPDGIRMHSNHVGVLKYSAGVLTRCSYPLLHWTGTWTSEFVNHLLNRQQLTWQWIWGVRACPLLLHSSNVSRNSLRLRSRSELISQPFAPDRSTLPNERSQFVVRMCMNRTVPHVQNGSESKGESRGQASTITQAFVALQRRQSK